MHIHVYMDLNTFNNHVLAPTRPSLITSKISTSVTMNKSVNGTLSIKYSHCLEESFSVLLLIYLSIHILLCYRLITKVRHIGVHYNITLHIFMI